MSDATLTMKRRGPLDGRALPQETDFSLSVAPAACRLILRGDAETASISGSVYGAALPRALGQAGVANARAALWLGPDEWLLIAKGEAPEAIKTTLFAALSGRPHSLVDISQRQIGLVASGRLAARALSAGCPLDLSEAAFPVGLATRTMLAKTEIVLWRRAPQRFHLDVWRSFSDYVASYLTEAARRAPR